MTPGIESAVEVAALRAKPVPTTDFFSARRDPPAPPPFASKCALDAAASACPACSALFERDEATRRARASTSRPLSDRPSDGNSTGSPLSGRPSPSSSTGSPLSDRPAAGSLAAFDAVPDAYLIPPDHPVSGMSRTEAGLVLDRELMRLAGVDHRCRLVQARLARRLVETRAWRPRGFVRLSDYARERLGCSPRTLEDDARVLKAADSLPLIRAALEDGAISWTQARLLVRVATDVTQRELLGRAATLSTRELEVFVRSWNASAGGNETRASENEDQAGDPIDAESRGPTDEETGEPVARWNTPVSPTGLRVWRSVCEIARRMAGTPLSNAQVLELVAAEAASGEPADTDPNGWMPTQEYLEKRLLEPRRHDEERSRRSLEAFRALVGVIEGFEWLDPVSLAPGPAQQLDALVESLDAVDAAELERRLVQLRRIADRIDYQMSALLRIGSDRRLFREVGFATVKLYMESRLGCSSRRLWSLVAIERESWRRGGALREAWREGRISPVVAATLIPVMDEIHGEAWIRRAGEVTLRRLADEVAWALDNGERPWPRAMPAPPPPDAVIPPGGLSSVDLHEVQMRAHGEAHGDGFDPHGGARLSFRIPVSVAVLLEMQIHRYRRRCDLPWRAFERVVSHALLEWTSAPKHRDPVFERDGWRCAVPGCSSRRNLHDHHVRFRSHGGTDDRANRITVCAAHHLHGIHAGIVFVEGRAPDVLTWRMGSTDAVRLRGERYEDAA